jgi:hypothetical protein
MKGYRIALPIPDEQLTRLDPELKALIAFRAPLRELMRAVSFELIQIAIEHAKQEGRTLTSAWERLALCDSAFFKRRKTTSWAAKRWHPQVRALAEVLYSFGVPYRQALGVLEWAYIDGALLGAQGNRVEAARRLSVCRNMVAGHARRKREMLRAGTVTTIDAGRAASVDGRSA